MAALGAACTAADPTLASGDPAAKFQLTVLVRDLPKPTDIASLPDGRLVITLKEGEVVVRNADGTLRRNAATIPVTVPHNEQGLLGVVAHPQVAENATLFFYASLGDTENRHHVVKGTVGADGAVAVDMANPVVRMGLAGPRNHNGGGMVIHDNHLYIGVGDTGANATPPQNKFASCLNKANGKILRVALDGSVPADNPLNGMAMVTGCDQVSGDFGMRPPDERIYAWGTRNPYRFWIDPTTGLLWVADVGEAAREEISLGTKGTHFGYPFFEGSVGYSQPWNIGCKGMVPGSECATVAHEYPTGSGGADCVIGGLIPDGCGWPAEYRARYFFGDHGSGEVWTLDVNADRRGVAADSRRAFASIAGVSSFRMGHDHSLYAVSHDKGWVVKITPRDRPAECQ
jgi:glucose/arabinose dehydrogenase